MEKLLERWAELAPDECKKVKGTWILLGRIVPKDTFLDFTGILIQRIMQAIEARGWFYNQSNSGVINGEAKYVCSVSRVEKNISLKRSNHSPAHALLSAYLTAIESEVPA